jgi:hypothetical protein
LHERKDLRFFRLDLRVFRTPGSKRWGGGGGHFKLNYVTKIRYVTCIEMPQCAVKYLILNRT